MRKASSLTVQPHPVPEVVARPATPDETPESAKLLADRARAAGWLVCVTYARGVRLGDLQDAKRVPLVDPFTGKPQLTDKGRQRFEVIKLDTPRVTDSIAVRAHRGDQRLVGLWVEGSFSTGLSARPYRVLNSRELTAAAVTS